MNGAKREQEAGSDSESEAEDAAAGSSKAIDIDVSKLNPLLPEVISKQATINIG
jgi:translation initiation factor 2 subunit 3